MKKVFKYFIFVVLILPCVFIFSACNSKYVVDIQRSPTSTSVQDIYTITYSDGSTSSITIKNGKNGKDLTIQDIYNQFKQQSANLSFSEFLELYLDITISGDSSQTVAENLSSSVAITCEYPIISGNIFNKSKDIAIGSGSGVIYKLDKQTGDAYIITNYHVVYNTASETSDKIASKIVCYTYGTSMARGYKLDELENKILNENGYPIIEYDSNAITCEYLGGSMQYDIAVLKVSGSEVLKNGSNKAVTVKNSNDVQVGTSAIAIGNPEGNGISVTKGIVSVDSEYLTMTGADEVSKVTFRVMRIDTAVNAGNSGGGLFDGNGELIGIVNAKIIDSKIENIGYAIPSVIATRVADNIITNASENNKSPKKVTIGVTVTGKNSRSFYDEQNGTISIIEDVEVTQVAENSLAQKYSFLKGDVIKSVTIKGTKHTINRMYNLIDLCWLMDVGDIVEFGIKDKESIKVIITADCISVIE